jgi:ubiquinone/menaquinone biosynthesis C-methylase UbiE
MPGAGSEDEQLNRPEPAEAIAQLKQRAKTTWSLGDYASIAARELWPIGAWIIERLAVRPNEHVLDVACGTGNAAIRAALAGARTVGVDLTPKLLETANTLAARAGATVDWREGDAEDLPFADDHFDVVVSTFGCMFAPRHDVTARELARVLRPGGRMGLCTWPADSTLGRIMQTIGTYMPALPPSAGSPLSWGREDYVRSLFEGTCMELEFERKVAGHEPFESAEADIEFHATRFGPLMAARAITEADGRWEALRAELVPLHEDRTSLEFLVVLGRKLTARSDRP